MIRTGIGIFGMLMGLGTMAHAAPLDTLVDASTAFLGSLDANQRDAAVLPFNDEERLNWHFVPKQRAGFSIKEMNEDQQKLALDVLRAALSGDGFEKIETIRSLEDVLRELEGSEHRDHGLYYFTFFGEPTVDGTWGFRYEGHHISLNWTIVEGAIIATVPQFLGANPAEVPSGSMKGTRALQPEEDLARKLVQSLDEDQRSACVLHPSAPADILTGAQREVAMLEDLGVGYAQLDEEQQGIVMSLIQVYVGCQLPDIAKARLSKIRKAGLETIKFAWMGGIEKRDKHYYRIQGPTFLIEYDNTQNDANHIHTVWRDFNGDFGRDVLNEHYAQHVDAAHPGEHTH